jgi:hypothetical protein
MGGIDLCQRPVAGGRRAVCRYMRPIPEVPDAAELNGYREGLTSMRTGTAVIRWASPVLAVLAVAGCGGSAATVEHPLQRVKVIAREGPTTPVCRASTPCDSPYRGRFDLIAADGHHLAIATDGRGRAVADIPAGRYEIATAPNHRFPRLASVVVAGRRVPSTNGRYVFRLGADENPRLILIFDTGIR